jgi:predicted regulator of Ras-like GTPase activity (Roadblock/LC7/MglB family)
MKEVLQRLNTVPAVRGSAFFDFEGTCLTAYAPDLVDEQELSGLGGLVVSLFSRTTGPYLSRVQTAIFRYEDGALVVKRARESFLVVWGRPGIDLGTGADGFHISVAARLLAIHSSRVPPRTSQTMAVASPLDAVPGALKVPRVPRM